MGRAVSEDVLQQYMFRVEIEGETVAAFSEVDGLGAEKDEAVYSPGGQGFRMKLPGLETVDDVTCRQGIAFKSVGQALFRLYKAQQTDENFRKSVTIILQDRFGNPVHGWTLIDAWIKRWGGPSLDGNSSDVALQEIVISAEQIIVMS